ncbi:phage protein NinX family protein, partial [Xenorhabdus bovienii]|uniref:phage protein NinX family protein n=1 Tax=Xenorhabdus bovienii TaxID=40576 RepID=UPI003DA28805
MKIKTSELTGRALDWAVCLAIGGAANKDNTEVQAPNRDYYLLSNGKGNFTPSTDWSQCGQLIEKHHVG